MDQTAYVATDTVRITHTVVRGALNGRLISARSGYVVDLWMCTVNVGTPSIKSEFQNNPKNAVPRAKVMAYSFLMWLSIWIEHAIRNIRHPPMGEPLNLLKKIEAPQDMTTHISQDLFSQSPSGSGRSHTVSQFPTFGWLGVTRIGSACWDCFTNIAITSLALNMQCILSTHWIGSVHIEGLKFTKFECLWLDWSNITLGQKIVPLVNIPSMT